MYVTEVSEVNRNGSNAYSNMQHQSSHCVIEYENPSTTTSTCCGLIRLRTAVFIVSAVEFIGVTLNLIISILAYFNLNEENRLNGYFHDPENIRDIIYDYVYLRPKITLISSSTGATLAYLVIGIMIFGLVYEKPYLFLPHMILQICAILGLFVPIGMYVVDAGRSGTLFGKEDVKPGFTTRLIFDVLVLEIFLLALVLNIVFLFIIRRYYRFLRQTNSALIIDKK